MLYSVAVAVACAIAVITVSAAPTSSIILGFEGDSCLVTCGLAGRSCIDSIDTGNTTALFSQVGITCKSTAEGGKWWAADQPSFIADPTDPNFGDCLGYIDVPATSFCQARFATVRRLCNCGGDITAANFFGTGLSAGVVDQNETKIFAHVLEAGAYGVMNHFWITAPGSVPSSTIIRYYIDGETTASIEFQAGMAAGIGFGDDKAPRGSKWIGVGAGNGQGANYFNNFNIPFSRSVVVTVQLPGSSSGGFYIIVRGAKNKKINIGGFDLPPQARLVLQKQSLTMQPLDFLSIVNVPTGNGLLFMSTIAVSSGNLNFLEGCFHAYTNPNTSDWLFPGTVLSTGTEDYFDRFYFPVSGFTHFNNSAGRVTWSAYRFHEMDPLPFDNGFRYDWRNGDMVDPHTGNKCFTLSGGPVVGSPTASQVSTYGWVYVWP